MSSARTWARQNTTLTRRPWQAAQPYNEPTDGTFNSPTEGVQATIDTGSLSVGRHVVFMRGRGANDFQGYQTWGAVLGSVPGCNLQWRSHAHTHEYTHNYTHSSHKHTYKYTHKYADNHTHTE